MGSADVGRRTGFGQLFFEQRILAWRTALGIAALLLAVQLPFELRYPGWRVSATLRIVWVGLLLAAIPGVHPRRPRIARAVAYAAGVVSGVFASGIVAASSGPSGPRFGYLLAFPLVVAVLAPDVPWAAGAMGFTCLLGGLWMLVGRVDPWVVAEWAVLSLMASALAIFGTTTSRRLFGEELRWRTAHEEASRKLAEAERLAAVGRLAAAVTHQVGSPLSVVKANLQFLLATPGAAALDPEAGEALRESVACSDRVARILADLRGLTREVEPAAPIDLAALVAEAIERAGVAAWTSLRLDLSPGVQVMAGRRGLLLGLVALLGEGGAAREHPVVIEAARSGGTLELRLRGGSPRAGGDEALAAELAVVQELLVRSGVALSLEDGGRVVTLRLEAA